MKKQFLWTVSALILVSSVGFGVAQEKGGGSGTQAPPAQQPSAAGGGAGARPDNGSQPSQHRLQDDQNGNRAQGVPAKQNQAQQPAERREQRINQQSQDREQQNRRDQQTQERQQPDRREQQSRDRDNNPQKDTTTGQGAAGSSGGASLTTEQRTKIATTIKQTNVRPVTNVNFNISVGTVVPREITLHPLPPAVVEIYPEWRPYRFVLVREQIIVIDPATHRIVAVIEA